MDNGQSHAFYQTPVNCQVPDLSQKWEVLFGRRRKGYFVEVGAYDGENFSNTSCLADVGWSGLYIEPIQEFAQKCRERHAQNVAVKVIDVAASDEDGLAEIYIGDTLTTLISEQVADYEKIDWAKGLHQGQKRTVSTRTLDTILKAEAVPTGFDVLVVDVEGAEAKVFKGFDLERWRPKSLLLELEDNHPDFESNARVVDEVRAIRARVEAAGYQPYFQDCINTLYVRADVLSTALAGVPSRAEQIGGRTPTSVAMSVLSAILNRLRGTA